MKLTMISAQYSQCNYYEDDWQIIRTITNEKELYEALKEGYLKDASNRSNYPLSGFPIDRSFIYEDLSEYEGETFLGGFYYDEEFEPDNPDLRDAYDNEEIDLSEYQHIFDKYEKWERKLKTLIPKIRKRSETIQKEKREIENLFKLANKYNYKLIKDK